MKHYRFHKQQHPTQRRFAETIDTPCGRTAPKSKAAKVVAHAIQTHRARQCPTDASSAAFVNLPVVSTTSSTGTGSYLTSYSELPANRTADVATAAAADATNDHHAAPHISKSICADLDQRLLPAEKGRRGRRRLKQRKMASKLHCWKKGQI